MAERTTVNVGEPANETPVDAVPRPPGTNIPENRDQNRFMTSGDGLIFESENLNETFDKLFPDLDSVNRSDYDGFFEQSDGGQGCTDPDWNDKDSNYKDSSYHISGSDVLYRIMPLIGATSFECFSIKIMNPSWFLRTFAGIDQRVGNALWLQSQVGIGLFIFSRRHIRALAMSRRILYSIFGSFLFNYGSCLFWALVKTYPPSSIPVVRVGFGLLTGGILLYVGNDYLQSVDKMCSDQID